MCWGTCIYFTVFCGRLDLNIFSMRSVIKKPPTTLLVAATMAMVPRTVDSVLLCSPTNKMAPTTAMASSAFVSDMSGVCSKGETRLNHFESDESCKHEDIQIGHQI